MNLPPVEETGFHRISDVEVKRTAAALQQLQDQVASHTASLMMLRTAAALAREGRDKAMAHADRLITLLSEIVNRLKLIMPHFDYEGFDSPEQYDLANKAHDELAAYLDSLPKAAPKLEVVDSVALETPESITCNAIGIQSLRTHREMGHEQIQAMTDKEFEDHRKILLVNSEMDTLGAHIQWRELPALTRDQAEDAVRSVLGMQAEEPKL